jgi:hypothetical protein
MSSSSKIRGISQPSGPTLETGTTGHTLILVTHHGLHSFLAK